MKNELVKIDSSLLELFATNTETGICPFQKEIFLQEITIAGTGYCDEIDELFPELMQGTILELLREPKNEHDELAIGVWYKQVRIGWVPQKQNTVVARLMDAGKNICVRISSLTEEDDNWKRIDGKMYMID